jgi:hypothetical protein
MPQGTLTTLVVHMWMLVLEEAGIQRMMKTLI